MPALLPTPLPELMRRPGSSAIFRPGQLGGGGSLTIDTELERQ